MFTYPVTFNSSSEPPEILHLDNAGQGSAGPTYTFNGINFGTASPDRLIVVSIAGFRSATRQVNTCTIGGVSATIINHFTAAQTQMATAYAVVPSGTSGTVVVTWNFDQADCNITVTSIKNLKSTTPTITLTDIETSGTPSITFSADPKTALLATGQATQAASITISWGGTAGLTEISDDTFFNNNGALSTAALVNASAISSKTVNFTPLAGISNRRLSLMGWE